MPENDTQTDFKSQLKKKPHNIIINNNRREQTAKPNTKYTDKQRFRKYKTKVEPNLLKRIEVNDDEDIVNRIKEAFTSKALTRDVETAPTAGITMPSEFNNGVDELPVSRRFSFDPDELSPELKNAHREIERLLSESGDVSQNGLNLLREFAIQKYEKAMNAGEMPDIKNILQELKAKKFRIKTSESAKNISDITPSEVEDLTGTAIPFTDYKEEQLFQLVPTVNKEGNYELVHRLRNDGDLYFTPQEEDYIMNQAETLEERTRVANEILRERKEKDPRTLSDPGFLAYLRMIKERGIGITEEERRRTGRGRKNFEPLNKTPSTNLTVQIPERRAPAQISPSKSILSGMTTVPNDDDNIYAAIFEKHPQLKAHFPDLLTYHNYHIKRGERKENKNVKSYEDAYEYFIKTKRRNEKEGKSVDYKTLRANYALNRPTL